MEKKLNCAKKVPKQQSNCKDGRSRSGAVGCRLLPLEQGGSRVRKEKKIESNYVIFFHHFQLLLYATILFRTIRASTTQYCIILNVGG